MTADGFDFGAAFDRAKGARPYLRRPVVVGAAGAIVGFNLFDPSSYHEVVDNPGKVVSDAAHAVDAIAKPLQPILDAAKSIASNAIGAISLIPGIGTGVAAALSAGLAVLEGGSPIDIAIKTAYGALPIPPGVKQFTDLVLDAILALVDAGGNLEAAAVTAIKNGILAKIPDFAKGLASSAFDTLAHLVIQHSTGKPTIAATGKPLPGALLVATQALAKAGKPLPAHVTPIPPKSKAHLALHLGLALKKPAAPPKKITVTTRAATAAVKPLSTAELTAFVTTQAPQIVRSTMLLPPGK